MHILFLDHEFTEAFQLYAKNQAFASSTAELRQKRVEPNLQATSWVGGKVVKGLQGLDSKLEESSLLPKLNPAEEAPEALDDDGQLLQNCAQVGSDHSLRRLK